MSDPTREETTNETTVARSNLVTGTVLALLAAVAVQVSYAQVNPAVTAWTNSNYWFDSDAPLVFGNLTNTTSRWGDHSNTRRHPIFVLLGHGVTQTFATAGGASEHTAVGLALSASAALAAALLFALLRTLGLRTLDAAIFTAVAALSAGSVFWFSVPETYPFAAGSILAALLLVARAEQGRPPSAWLATAVAAATLAITSTNWLFGLLMLLAVFPWRRAVALATVSLGVVLVGWTVQRAIAPSAAFFLGLADQDARFFFHPDALGAGAIARAFFSHVIVMPELITDRPTGLSVQGAAIGSAGWAALIATPVWLALLVRGGWEALGTLRTTRFVRVLVAAIVAQFALHLAFGRETFLYGLHFAPLLVILAALGTTGAARSWVLTAATVLCTLLAWNNLGQFRQAAESLERRSAPHAAVPEGSGDCPLLTRVRGARLDWAGPHLHPHGTVPPTSDRDSCGTLAFIQNDV